MRTKKSVDRQPRPVGFVPRFSSRIGLKQADERRLSTAVTNGRSTGYNLSDRQNGVVRPSHRALSKTCMLAGECQTLEAKVVCLLRPLTRESCLPEHNPLTSSFHFPSKGCGVTRVFTAFLEVDLWHGRAKKRLAVPPHTPTVPRLTSFPYSDENATMTASDPNECNCKQRRSVDPPAFPARRWRDFLG